MIGIPLFHFTGTASFYIRKIYISLAFSIRIFCCVNIITVFYVYISPPIIRSTPDYSIICFSQIIRVFNFSCYVHWCYNTCTTYYACSSLVFQLSIIVAVNNISTFMISGNSSYTTFKFIIISNTYVSHICALFHYCFLRIRSSISANSSNLYLIWRSAIRVFNRNISII